MNTSEKYIYQVYLQKSFSAAAKTLFVSQPSLSATVASKERELGFSIFNRATKPISLTAEGLIYIDMLEEMLESEQNMQSRIKNLMDNKSNQLTIAGNSSTAFYLFPPICKKFYSKHPEVSVKLDIGSFRASTSLIERHSLFQKLHKGEVDAVLCYEHHEQNVLEFKICDERLIVAVHKDLVPARLLPSALTRRELSDGIYPSEKEIKERDFFKEIPFIDYSKKCNTARYMTALLGQYATAPYSISNSIHSVVHFNMMLAGIGALLTSDLIILASPARSDDILYFAFDREISQRSVYLVTRKETPRRARLEEFIEIAQTGWDVQKSMF